MKPARLPFAVLLAALALAASAGTAAASGFALKEQSASAQGNAFAGAAAGAEDVSAMFFNPAALARQSGSQAAAVLSFIAPQADFEKGRASTAAGTPIAGGADPGDAAEDALVPALYLGWAATDDLRLGLGVNAPFGLETRYPRDWIGRYHAVHSRLKTVNINPALAWRVSDRISLGAGFQAQWAWAELTNAVDLGTIGAAAGVPGALPGAQDGFADLEGDDWGYGWNAGVLLEPAEGTRLGVSYRSRIEHTLEGDVDFTLDPAGVGAALRAGAGLFRNTDAKADLTTPEAWAFGIHHEITPRFAVMAEADFTRWSRFEELRIEFDNPAQPDSVTEEDWRDTWFYALGATFRPAEAWTLRAGVAHDETPVPDRTRTPRIPDGDRTWLSLGVGWRPAAPLSFDAAYTHIWVDDAELDLRTTGIGNASRGNLSGSYDNAIDIATVQIAWRF